MSLSKYLLILSKTSNLEVTNCINLRHPSIHQHKVSNKQMLRMVSLRKNLIELHFLFLNKLIRSVRSKSEEEQVYIRRLCSDK